MSFHGLIAHFFLVLNNIPLSVYITVYLTIHLLNDILVTWASLVAQRLKPLPSMRETWVRSLGREDALEKEMATHSSILAWRIPWTVEPGRLRSMGLQRLKQLSTHILWRRQWQPTPVLLPGESHGQRSLVGYSPWGLKPSDMTMLV